IPWVVKRGEVVSFAIVVGFEMGPAWLAEVKKIVLTSQLDTGSLSIHLVAGGKASEPIAAELLPTLGPSGDEGATGEFGRESGPLQAAARAYPPHTAPAPD